MGQSPRHQGNLSTATGLSVSFHGIEKAERIIISLAAAETVLPLRAVVLRPGLPLEAARFAGDDTRTTWHFAAHLSDGSVVGVASYFLEVYPGLPAHQPYRLRGMATHPAYQRRTGVGSRLLMESLSFLSRRNVDLVWCYARLVAVPFYARMGFSHHEEAGVIEIPGIGPHEVWYRFLTG